MRIKPVIAGKPFPNAPLTETNGESLKVKVRCIEIRRREDAQLEMERIGVDPVGIGLMLPKQFHFNLKLTGLSPAQANIIKQDMLSLGGEAAVAKGVVSCRVVHTDCILSATLKQLRRLVKKLKLQPYGLPEVASSIGEALDNATREEVALRGRTRSWTISRRTLIMGILNVTPDSFSDGGIFLSRKSAVERAMEMVEEGADIIDVGGESTRPGAGTVSAEEELSRVIPVVEELASRGIAVSVDTTKAAVAEEALCRGAEIINDVSAMGRDPDMAGVVARHGAAVILMHMRSTPADMQEHTHYDDMMTEIFNHLSDRVDYAVRSGIERERIAVDPGIGFAKSCEGNLEIIRRLAELRSLGRPVVLGTSRKSFIGAVTGRDVDERLVGTLATLSAGILNGARILRVHDVKEARETADMVDAVRCGPPRTPATQEEIKL